MERIGFIGLGIMGRPMACNLVRAGFPVTVWNRSHSGMDAVAAAGAVAAADPRAVAEASDVLLTMVTDSPDVEAVLLGERGAGDGLRPGGRGNRYEHHQPARDPRHRGPSRPAGRRHAGRARLRRRSRRRGRHALDHDRRRGGRGRALPPHLRRPWPDHRARGAHRRRPNRETVQSGRGRDPSAGHERMFGAGAEGRRGSGQDAGGGECRRGRLLDVESLGPPRAGSRFRRRLHGAIAAEGSAPGLGPGGGSGAAAAGARRWCSNSCTPWRRPGRATTAPRRWCGSSRRWAARRCAAAVRPCGSRPPPRTGFAWRSAAPGTPAPATFARPPSPRRPAPSAASPGRRGS